MNLYTFWSRFVEYVHLMQCGTTARVVKSTSIFLISQHLWLELAGWYFLLSITTSWNNMLTYDSWHWPFYKLLCCVNRDISFLCDSLAAQRQRIFLPPMPDRATISLEDTQKASQAKETFLTITVIPVLWFTMCYFLQDMNSTETLIPEEYHIISNKGVKNLQCYDE